MQNMSNLWGNATCNEYVLKYAKYAKDVNKNVLCWICTTMTLLMLNLRNILVNIVRVLPGYIPVCSDHWVYFTGVLWHCVSYQSLLNNVYFIKVYLSPCPGRPTGSTTEYSNAWVPPQAGPGGISWYLFHTPSITSHRPNLKSLSNVLVCLHSFLKALFRPACQWVHTTRMYH